LEWKNIDEIVLVGGSTRMPMVKNMLTSLSGKTIKEDIEPDLCVAEGAAIAAMLEKKGNNYIEEWSDITSHGLGVAIRSSDKKDKSYYNSVIIPKFSKLPAKQSKRFKIEKDSTTVICKIYQGEHNESVNNCIDIGNLILENIPKRTDSDATIEIILEYDKNGIIQANIIDLFSGMTKHGEIDQRSSLSKKEIEDDKEYIKEFILSSN
jgi:molecular chaperone DnaK